MIWDNNENDEDKIGDEEIDEDEKLDNDNFREDL